MSETASAAIEVREAEPELSQSLPQCRVEREDAAECPNCGTTMRLWAAYYRCRNCGYKESCCF